MRKDALVARQVRLPSEGHLSVNSIVHSNVTKQLHASSWHVLQNGLMAVAKMLDLLLPQKFNASSTPEFEG